MTGYAADLTHEKAPSGWSQLVLSGSSSTGSRAQFLYRLHHFLRPPLGYRRSLQCKTSITLFDQPSAHNKGGAIVLVENLL